MEMFLRFAIHVVRVKGRIDDTARHSKGWVALILKVWSNIFWKMYG
jgi:hypothetical protein